MAMVPTSKKSITTMLAGIALASTAFVLPNVSSAASTPQYTFAMITHGQPGDTFWDIIRRGAEAAAKQDGVKLIYLANPNATKQAQLVRTATVEHVNGIAATLAFPHAMIPALKAAEKAGIPVVGFNAGPGYWKKAGMLTYVGQDATIAGEEVGKRLQALGAKNVVCLDQQQGAVQLAARCNGIKKTFKGPVHIVYTPGYNMATAQSRLTAKLEQNPKIDYVITLGAPFVRAAYDAIRQSGSHAKLATFDLNPEAVKFLKEGRVQFAVDQQPYLQGYESINLLWLYLHNFNKLGGGKAVLTGPTFDTKQNVNKVAKYAARGTRG